MAITLTPDIAIDLGRRAAFGVTCGSFELRGASVRAGRDPVYEDRRDPEGRRWRGPTGTQEAAAYYTGIILAWQRLTGFDWQRLDDWMRWAGTEVDDDLRAHCQAIRAAYADCPEAIAAEQQAEQDVRDLLELALPYHIGDRVDLSGDEALIVGARWEPMFKERVYHLHYLTGGMAGAQSHAGAHEQALVLRHCPHGSPVEDAS
jgi:hypothetical protein